MPKPPEDLLWEMTESDGRPDDEAAAASTDDETLRAYREGRLSAAQIDAVESALAKSARARARLAELSGLPPLLPVERVHRRLLGAVGAPSHRRRGARWIAAAAAAVILLALPIAYRSFRGERADQAWPSGLAFDVRVEGLAAMRGGAGAARALPRAPLRIVVEPRVDGIAGLTFALYRERGGRLERLAPGDGLTVEESRGSALFTTTAEALVGAAPGERAFFVVVTRDGPLPDSLPLDPAQPAETMLETKIGGSITRSTVTVVDETFQDAR